MEYLKKYLVLVAMVFCFHPDNVSLDITTKPKLELKNSSLSRSPIKIATQLKTGKIYLFYLSNF